MSYLRTIISAHQNAKNLKYINNNYHLSSGIIKDNKNRDKYFLLKNTHVLKLESIRSALDGLE